MTPDELRVLAGEATREPEWDEMAAIRMENADAVRRSQYKLNALAPQLALLCAEAFENPIVDIGDEINRCRFCWKTWNEHDDSCPVHSFEALEKP